MQVTDSARLYRWGISLCYTPEEVDDFDEFEFVIDYKGSRNVVFLTTVEKSILRGFFWAGAYRTVET